VPVMLSLVAFANRTRKHFPASEESIFGENDDLIQNRDAQS
jgi:hypothetical protein